MDKESKEQITSVLQNLTCSDCKKKIMTPKSFSSYLGTLHCFVGKIGIYCKECAIKRHLNWVEA